MWVVVQSVSKTEIQQVSRRDGGVKFLNVLVNIAITNLISQSFSI
jgi:hypothetical protein